MNDSTPPLESFTRRDFVKASAVTLGASTVATTAAASLAAPAGRWVQGSDTIRVGLVGCGGRGSGAAMNALEASDRVQIVALGDVFPDRLQGCRDRLSGADPRGAVAESKCHTGWDAYKRVIAEDIDYVILATPPHFRPEHFDHAIRNGRNVFMEKPVAVDPAGIRKVFAAADMADEKNLSVVAGTQRRHQPNYIAAMDHIKEGGIGDVVSARCYWNMGGLWMKEPRDAWSDMEWQLRNWLYFTWLSGDHIVEQHVHNLDVCNWAIGSHPVKAMGMGGRQVRTHANYGNIFDHFAVEYEYPNDVFMMSMCRQTDGCAGKVSEAIHGSDGVCYLSPGRSVVRSGPSWQYDGPNPNPYVEEHRMLVASISGEVERENRAREVAESTLTAIMGRMSAYTGKAITWDEALNSELNLDPPVYEFSSMPVRPVSVPGKTPLV